MTHRTRRKAKTTADVVCGRLLVEEAIGAGTLPDPIVLDHLGDALYRQGYPVQAAVRWKTSLQRLGDEEPGREELKKLKEQLQLKLKQVDQGLPVTVAPIVNK